MASESAPVTIRQVAERAGVSATTASRVLNGQATRIPISAATRQRITAAAGELGYHPNVFARGLRTRRTRILGLIVTDVNDPFFTEVIHGVDRVGKERGYRILLSNAGLSAQEEVAYGTIFSRSLVEGVLVLGSHAEGELSLAQIAREHRHTVLVARDNANPPPVSVHVDNYSGATAALAYLHELGHRRIGLVYNPQNWGMASRFAAYRAFLARHALGFRPDYACEECHDYAGGVRAASRILATPEPPTAIFAANDRMALGVMHAAWRRGLRVPEDLSVVGFDDVAMSEYLVPPLTTVRQPMVELGRRAADLLVDLVEGSRDPSTLENVALKPQLIVRESCAPPPRRS